MNAFSPQLDLSKGNTSIAEAHKANKKELVSIIVPAFNRSLTIVSALDSILRQTYPDWEAIVVDDGSTDDTPHIVTRYSKIDRRIRLLKHTNRKGAQAARNTGIFEAKGSWIAFLDSDDQWEPDSLECRLQLAINKGVHVVHSECHVLEAGDTHLRPFGVPPMEGHICKQILQSPGPMFQGLLVSKEALIKIGYLDESIISWQEWDTAIRLAKIYEFGFQPKPTFIYDCRHPGTISNNALRNAAGYQQVFQKHKWAILRNLGPRGLSRHYEELSAWYEKANQDTKALHCKLAAILWWPQMIRTRLRHLKRERTTRDVLGGSLGDVSVKGIEAGNPDQQVEVGAPFISLIIPTLNRCEILKNAIASAQQQTWHADRYEIIVVDNGSTDGTSQHIERVAEQSEKPVRLISEPRLGLHNARHAGARAARGEILIFSDDDATFDPDWIRAYGEAFIEHPEMMAAGGPVRPVWEAPPPQWLLDYMGGAKTFGILSLMEPYQEFRLARTGSFFGVNMAIRRSVFAWTGFHPELFGSRTVGDGESGLNRDILRNGGLIGYIPDALVYHHIPPSRMTINYIRKWAWHIGGAEMYERWWNKKRSLVALACEGIIVARQYWRQWVADCLVHSRRDPWAIEKQFQASVGWCKLNYIWWMLTDPQVQAALDEKDLRP